MLKIIFACLLPMTLFAGQEPKKQKAWSEFRTAFLAKDYKKLAAMAKFPVQVKGTLTGEPQLTVSEKNFSVCFSFIYEKDVGVGAEPLTHEAYIKKNADLGKIMDGGKPISLTLDDGFRVGDLVFSAGSFKLERFYLETSDPEAKEKCK